MRSIPTALLLVPAALALVLGLILGAPGPDSRPAAPADSHTTPTLHTGGSQAMEKATFAAGCFWGVEAAFRQTKGVLDATVGYCGGHTRNPNYKQVCTGTTGHAESVEVLFDPSVISYEELLDVFWDIHNPTTPNRQGPDIGTQYRSVIFYHTPEQKAAAEASKTRLDDSGRYKRQIVTEIVPAAPFHPAEEYHQRYLEKRGMAACHLPGAAE